MNEEQFQTLVEMWEGHNEEDIELASSIFLNMSLQEAEDFMKYWTKYKEKNEKESMVRTK